MGNYSQYLQDLIWTFEVVISVTEAFDTIIIAVLFSMKECVICWDKVKIL